MDGEIELPLLKDETVESNAQNEKNIIKMPSIEPQNVEVNKDSNDAVSSSININQDSNVINQDAAQIPIQEPISMPSIESNIDIENQTPSIMPNVSVETSESFVETAKELNKVDSNIQSTNVTNNEQLVPESSNLAKVIGTLVILVIVALIIFLIVHKYMF